MTRTGTKQGNPRIKIPKLPEQERLERMERRLLGLTPEIRDKVEKISEAIMLNIHADPGIGNIALSMCFARQAVAYKMAQPLHQEEDTDGTEPNTD